MGKIKYEQKFIVINEKHLDMALRIGSTDQRDCALKFERVLETLNWLKVLPNNKYIVCNKDEPYARDVINIILDGERAKVGKKKLHEISK